MKQRVRKKRWSRLSRQTHKWCQRHKGRHDIATYETREKTPEERITALVNGGMLQRSFHDGLFPHLTYRSNG